MNLNSKVQEVGGKNSATKAFITNFNWELLIPMVNRNSHLVKHSINKCCIILGLDHLIRLSLDILSMVLVKISLSLSKNLRVDIIIALKLLNDLVIFVRLSELREIV
jgi:hypothetical protein